MTNILSCTILSDNIHRNVKKIQINTSAKSKNICNYDKTKICLFEHWLINKYILCT